jgi:hypothetical protein
MAKESWLAGKKVGACTPPNAKPGRDKTRPYGGCEEKDSFIPRKHLLLGLSSFIIV